MTEPLLPDRAAEDRDDGWGGATEDAESGSDEWYRRERPPHHDAGDLRD